MKDEIKVITTSDGSNSLYVPSLNETYHSTHGAITESRHVFIKKGLDYLVTNGCVNIKVLEVGFGTGLNALLTLEYCLNNPNIFIQYVTLETRPLPESVTDQLNYSDIIEMVEGDEYLRKLHQCNWGINHRLLRNFDFKKEEIAIQEFEQETDFDLVFYDAFAPSKQPEMWDRDTLGHTFTLLKARGVLVTYCASGQFKRDIRSLGFNLETLDGPPGKKEMVRVTK